MEQYVSGAAGVRIPVSVVGWCAPIYADESHQQSLVFQRGPIQSPDGPLAELVPRGDAHYSRRPPFIPFGEPSPQYSILPSLLAAE